MSASPPPSPPLPDAAALQATLERAFPGSSARYALVAADDAEVVVDLLPGAADLRPGGTVAGPALMELADTAMWLAVLRVTALELNSVTTDLSIHFLRRPPAGPVRGVCRLLKVGRRLAVGDVRLFALAPGAGSAPVAQATVSYALA